MIGVYVTVNANEKVSHETLILLGVLYNSVNW